MFNQKWTTISLWSLKIKVIKLIQINIIKAINKIKNLTLIKTLNKIIIILQGCWDKIHSTSIKCWRRMAIRLTFCCKQGPHHCQNPFIRSRQTWDSSNFSVPLTSSLETLWSIIISTRIGSFHFNLVSISSKSKIILGIKMVRKAR